MKSFPLLITVALAALAAAENPPPASLDDLLREAAAKNPEALAARNRWEAARETVLPAKAWDDPMLTLRSTNPTSRGMPAEQTGDFGYGLAQRIPFFGKKALAGTIAEREAARAYEDYLGKLLDVAAAVKGAYYELYYAQKALDFSRENLRLLEDITQVTLARYGVGKAAQADVLRAQIESRKLAAQIPILERKQADATAVINRLLARPPHALVGRAGDFEPRSTPLDEASLWGLALGARPAIRAAQLDVARGDAAVELAKKQRYPDIEVGVGVMQFSGDRGVRGADVEVGIPLPWWNSKKYDAGVRRERANRAAAQQDLVNLRNMTMEEIHHLVTEAESARRLIALYRGGVLAQTRLNVEANRASYQTGQTDFLTLLGSQQTLLNTHLDLHRALADHEKALARIEQMIGQPLPKP
ncbi:MAG: TolC family protein [Verrucomicrobia bacterium]|nr:TolC family protein [Verrucomicrobiota bacterium]